MNIIEELFSSVRSRAATININSATLAFTVVYIICEIIYNLGFVEFISSANTEISVYNRLEVFGKALASIGLALILVKLVKRYKVQAFVALVPCLFAGQTFLFDYLVENLPADVKIKAYLSGVYRNASLNKTIVDERITNPSSYNKVLVSNIALMKENQKQKEQVADIFKIAIDSRIIDDYYENYSELNDRIGSYWSVYRIEDKRWSNYPAKIQERIDREFVKKSGGIPRGLSKPEFLERVAQNSPSYREYQDLVIVPGSEAFGIEEVKGRDIPMGLSKEQFRDFFNTRIEAAANRTALTADNVDNLPHSKELVSSVVIPPIALTLSFLSILLNGSVLLMGLNRYLLVIPALAAGIVYYTYEHNPYGLSEGFNKAVGLEATLHSSLKPVASIIKAISINDEHPNELEIVRIKKPAPIDFSDLEKKFESLSADDMGNLPDVATNITADETRLEKDTTYFGEIRNKSGINPYTGQPY